MRMETGQIILTRLLPKTGQTVVMYAGDDGTYQAGWWKGKTVANNKTRFLANTLDGDDIVLDLATGLMWAADGNELGCNNGGGLAWVTAIAYAEALDFAGFTDWRVPNINELLSIVNHSESSPSTYTAFFVNTAFSNYWSATHPDVFTDGARVVVFTDGASHSLGDGIPCGLRCVRLGL